MPELAGRRGCALRGALAVKLQSVESPPHCSAGSGKRDMSFLGGASDRPVGTRPFKSPGRRLEPSQGDTAGYTAPFSGLRLAPWLPALPSQEKCQDSTWRSGGQGLKGAPRAGEGQASSTHPAPRSNTEGRAVPPARAGRHSVLRRGTNGLWLRQARATSTIRSVACCTGHAVRCAVLD